MVKKEKNPPANAEDIREPGSVPESGRSPGEGNGNSLRYCCLENSMDRGAWWAAVHRVTTHIHVNGIYVRDYITFMSSSYANICLTHLLRTLKSDIF